MATYRGEIFARSPFYIIGTGTTLESAQLEVRIWSGDVVTDIPLSPQYTIVKTPLNPGDDDAIFEISPLIRDFFDHNRDAYIDVDTTFADVLWIEVTKTVVDSTGTTVTEDAYRATDGYGYFADGSNPSVLVNDFTMVVLQDEDIRLPIRINTSENNYIKFYDLNGTLRFDSGTIADGLNSQGMVSYITQSQGTWNMSRADVGHTAGSVNYTVTFIQSLQCQQDASEVKFYDKDGALSILWFLGKKKESLNSRGDEYRSDLGSLSGSVYSYSTEKHQQQTYNITAQESIVLNSGYIPESQNELYKQLLLSEFIWVDNEPVKLTSRNLEFKKNKEDKLINYTLNFQKSNDAINNI